MTNRQAVYKLLNLLEKYKKTIIMILSCLLITTGLSFCIPIISKNIIDKGFIEGNKRLLIFLALLIFVIYCVNSIIEMIKEHNRINIASNIQYHLFQEAFMHLMKLKIDFFNTANNTEIFNKLNLDIKNMTSIADENVFFVITQGFRMLGGVIGLFLIDVKLTLLVLLFIPVKFIIMKFFARKKRQFTDEFMQDSQELSRWFGDSIDGVKEIKLFNLINHKYKEFVKRQKDVIDKQKKMNMLGQWNIVTDVLLVQLLIAAIYIIGSGEIFYMNISMGSIFAFITYSTYVTAPISAILNVGYLMAGIIPSAKRYYEFMSLQEEDRENKEECNIIFNNLILKDVMFSFDQDDQLDQGKAFLKDINIEIVKGSKTALLGRNGAGKSTVINLITRMYTPTGGEIYLNGESVSNYNLKSYREIFSIVSQQVYLFDDTIRNNICLYKQVDENIIHEAIEDSGLTDFIKEVSLDYIVGTNGSMLSGGQKQKLALARALIHNKQIIIFDEATSNADIYSEVYINNLLKSRLADKTVIVITHRDGILQYINHAVYIDNGTINTVSKVNYKDLINPNEQVE